MCVSEVTVLMTVGTLEELVLAYSSGGGGRSSFVKLLTYFHENDENFLNQ